MNYITIEAEPTLEELAFVAEGPEDTSFFLMDTRAGSWAKWIPQDPGWNGISPRFPMQCYALNTPGGPVELNKSESACALVGLFETLDVQEKLKSSVHFLANTLCAAEGPEDKD